MEQTRLNFTVSVNGRTDYFNPTVMLDGKTAFDGQLISLGKHRFVITHPKGVTYATNMFTWYGGHHFGNIDLLRAKGTLAVTVDPPVPLLTIRGPEFSVTLTNSAGISSTVPTDEYLVEARDKYWENRQVVAVFENVPNTLVIKPRLGALQLSCNQSEATFRLVRGNDETVESGDFPATIVGLPAGVYNLVSWHHKRRWDVRPEVKSGATNDIQVEFKYGSAVVETKPPGASVTGIDGHYWGTTPLKLAELQPGTWRFILRLDNYETVTVPLEIIADEATTVRTNLTSQTYTGAMRAARKSMDAADYDSALESLGNALRANPDDPVASALVREAAGLRLIRRAEALGRAGDFIGGGVELRAALTYLPDNGQAKQMVADFKQREPEQIEKMRIERLERPRKAFDAVIKQTSGAGWFESYEFKTDKPIKEVLSSIVAQFRSLQLSPENLRSGLTPETEMFSIEAKQTLPGGLRRCVIVGGKSKDDEARIFFTVVESKKVGFMNQPITSLVGVTPAEYTLIDPRSSALTDKQRNQIAEGLSIVKAIIRSAIGQASSVEPMVVK